MQNYISVDSFWDVFNFVKGNREYWFIFAAILAVIGIGLVKVFLKRLRIKKIKTLAESSGFVYEEHPEFGFELRRLGIGLFGLGNPASELHSLKDASVLPGTWYFDYQYTVSGYRTSSTYNCAVALFKSAELSLPQFELSPETIADRINDLLAKSDIDLAQYPVFSQKYALSGPDRERIISLFSPALVAFFEQLRGNWRVQAADGCVIAFKNGYVSAEDYPAFIEEARTIFRAFLKDALNKPPAAATQARICHICGRSMGKFEPFYIMEAGTPVPGSTLAPDYVIRWPVVCVPCLNSGGLIKTLRERRTEILAVLAFIIMILFVVYALYYDYKSGTSNYFSPPVSRNR